MCKISVIIPVYNAEKHLDECLNSIVHQTMKEIEIICINDGSRDNSASVLRAWQKKDERIRLVNQENQGAAAARNAGIAVAEGIYVFFVDSDDYLPSKDVLENLYRKAVEEEVAVCGGSLLRVRENGEFYFSKHYVFEKDETKLYTDYQFDLGFWRFLYSRELLLTQKIVFPPYRNFEDPVFMVRAMYYAERIAVLSQNVYVYRDTPQSASKSMSQRALMDMVRGMWCNLRFAHDHQLWDLYNRTFRRINREARTEIEMGLNTVDEDRKLFDLLVRVNADIDWNHVDEIYKKMD